MQNTVFSLYLK